MFRVYWGEAPRECPVLGLPDLVFRQTSLTVTRSTWWTNNRSEVDHHDKQIRDETTAVKIVVKWFEPSVDS